MIFRWFESLIDVFGSPGEEPMPPTSIGRFYLFYLRQAWPVFLAIFVVGFFVAGIEVALFAFIGQIVDWVKQAPGPDFFTHHWLQLTWMAFVVVLARPFFAALHALLVNQTIMPHLTNRIRWQNHRYVIRQSLGFFRDDFAGRIANRIMRTGMSLRESAMHVVDSMWYIVVYIGSAIAMFAHADWRLAAPLVAWVIIYILLMAVLVPRIKERSWQSSAARSKLMGRIVDGYGNILALKLFSHHAREDAYVGEAVAEQTRKLARMTRIITALNSSVTALNSLLIAVTCGLALWLWSQGNISVGAIVLATGLVIRISNMSGRIMFVISQIFQNIGTVQDGMTTIARPQRVQDSAGAQALQVTDGAISCSNLQFGYTAGNPVFSGLNLDIRPGEKIGLVGTSGAGKSSLVSLLLRLYELDAGEIRIDGQNIRDVTQQSLRSQVGVVTQDTSLLRRSVRDNILYGRPGASEAQLMDAAHKAKADIFIPSLTDGKGRTGLDALVGERGVKLSGGQRQRIAIARVLLKDAPILILDEATSSLDSETEAGIQQSLDYLMQGKTVIAIAHRLSTIARMDRLIVMENGHIAEQGRHEQLVAQNGLYARLWQRQTGGFIVDENGN